MNVEIGLVHQVGNCECRTDTLAIFAIQQYLAFADLLVYQFIDLVKIKHNWNFSVDRYLVIAGVTLFEVCQFLILVVVNKIHQIDDAKIVQHSLTVRASNTTLR